MGVAVGCGLGVGVRVGVLALISPVPFDVGEEGICVTVGFKPAAMDVPSWFGVGLRVGVFDEAKMGMEKTLSGNQLKA